MVETGYQEYLSGFTREAVTAQMVKLYADMIKAH
jgi:hypothetical protein